MTALQKSDGQTGRATFRVVRGLHCIMFEGVGTFEAMNNAEAFLAAAGFSVGPSQRGAPRAVMFGDYAVSKWGNLNHFERHETHATLTGDGRHGPLTFRLLPAAPDEAIAALRKATGASS